MNFIDLLSADGKTRSRVADVPIVEIRAVSPDSLWADRAQRSR